MLRERPGVLRAFTGMAEKLRLRVDMESGHVSVEEATDLVHRVV